MKKFTVFTNNGIVVEFFENRDTDLVIKWISAQATEVLAAAKNAVLNGSVLLSDPLANIEEPANVPFLIRGSGAENPEGGVSPINPYLSVLIYGPGETVDFVSASKIDKAIRLYTKNSKLLYLKLEEDEINKFQTTDFDALIATIQYVERTL